MLKLQDRPVAGRYARALFSAACAQKTVEPIRRDLKRLWAAVAASPVLDEALRAPFASVAAKAALLKKGLGDFSPTIQRFVGLLLEKKRWDALRDIVPVYERLADEAGGFLAVRAETAVPLTEEQKQHIHRSFEKSWGGPVTLTTHVQEDLLGGVVFHVGDRVWDNSLKGQMQRLREVWLAGGAR